MIFEGHFELNYCNSIYNNYNCNTNSNYTYYLRWPSFVFISKILSITSRNSKALLQEINKFWKLCKTSILKRLHPLEHLDFLQFFQFLHFISPVISILYSFILFLLFYLYFPFLSSIFLFSCLLFFSSSFSSSSGSTSAFTEVIA